MIEVTTAFPGKAAYMTTQVEVADTDLSVGMVVPLSFRTFLLASFKHRRLPLSRQTSSGQPKYPPKSQS